MANEPPPFYERRRFQGAAALVMLLAAIWAFTGAPTPWKLVADLTSDELPASNTMLVLDVSAGMARPFTKSRTRFDAAARAVESFTVPLENEGLALRTFGGSCDQRGELVVDFGAEHGDDVRDATAEQQPRGQSNLVKAVRAAIDDFAQGDRFPRSDAKRIVIFTGTVDNCDGPAAATAIRDDIKHSGVSAVFKVVGIKVKKKDRRRLLAFKRALGRTAEIAFITEPADIEAVSEWIANKPPKVGDCSDGVDNDGDGRIDDDDPDCAVDGTEATATPNGDCSDGDDNDDDGRIDDDDPDCAVDGTEATATPNGDCSDGDDNDDDGRIDDDDPDCAVDGTEATATPNGDCSDGDDNDDDGRIDDDDPDCAVDGTEATATPNGDCSDGDDNDDDGRIDDDDPDCAVDGTEAPT